MPRGAVDVPYLLGKAGVVSSVVSINLCRHDNSDDDWCRSSGGSEFTLIGRLGCLITVLKTYPLLGTVNPSYSSSTLGPCQLLEVAPEQGNNY